MLFPIVGPIIGGIPIIILTFAEKGPTVAVGGFGLFHLSAFRRKQIHHAACSLETAWNCIPS